MTNAHPFPLDQADAPDTATGGLPTVRDVLTMPEVLAGAPELVAGSHGGEREVRWAHVVAGSGAVSLLDGGELVLTTGAGWPQDAPALRKLAEELVAAGPAAVLLELGGTFAEAPPALVEACDRAAVPLVLLNHEVRFVQITQRIHQRILATQNEALRARAEVHAMLTELGLNRSPVDYVVERLAETLDAAVVLEDSAHRVVAWSGHGEDPELTLAPWARADSRGPVFQAGWERVPVEARGTRWGFLTALPGAQHPAGRRTVLELGAFALALGRLADSDGEQWLRFGAKRLFDTLLGGRYRNDAELAAQLAAGGLPVEGRVVIAATLQGTGSFGAHASLERAILETALRRTVAPEGRALVAVDETSEAERPVLLALLSLPEADPRSALSSPDGNPPLAVRLARELDMLVPTPTPPSWRAHLALGSPGRHLRQIVASLEQVRAVGRLPSALPIGRVLVQQAARQPLAYLVRGLAGLPEVQEFASDMLSPLVRYDADQRGDLVQVLSAYLAHPTNRSLAAQKALLSRSVFYQRLALIEELLGVDLADGETITALTVALLARQGN